MVSPPPSRSKKRKRATAAAADVDDLVAELLRLLQKGKKGAELVRVLQGVLERAEACAQEEFFASVLCHEMQKSACDELLLGLLRSNTPAAKLAGRWFRLLFERAGVLPKTLKLVVDRIFDRVQDAVAVSVMEPLDDGVPIDKLDLKPLRKALKKEAKALDANGPALLAMLRLAALKLFADMDFDGFHTSVFIFEVVRRCFVSGVDEFIDLMEKDCQLALDNFVSEELESAKANHVRLATIFDSFQLVSADQLTGEQQELVG